MPVKVERSSENVPTVPRWTWAEISAALMSVPGQMLLLASRADVTDDAGCRRARAAIDDHVRRQLVSALDRAVE